MNVIKAISVLFFLFTLRAISFVYAEDIGHKQPPISQYEKIIVTTEQVSEEEQRDKKIDVYKTKIYKEVETTIIEPVSISEDENIVIEEVISIINLQDIILEIWCITFS